LILDGHVSGLFPESKKTTQLTQACVKRKRNINGGAWNDEGREGGNRLYAVVFWHQVRKKPELWKDNSKQLVQYPICLDRQDFQLIGLLDFLNL